MFLTHLLSLLCLASTPICNDQLTLTDQGNVLTTIDREEFTLLFPQTPVIDWNNLELYMLELDEMISKPPTNAFLDDSGRLQPETVGYTLNKQEFKKLYGDYYYSNGPIVASIPKRSVYPLVDSELLTRISVFPIGHYATYFNSYNQSRTNNIRKATEAINNHVVFPGELFSFNKVVGNRTKSKGYLPAPIIIKGELSEGIGGGICQVSSTLYNAVDKSGLKVIERYSHSKRVPYVPVGRDATVSWYGPDFVFKNVYKEPILIRARVSGGTMSVTLYSSEEVYMDKQHHLQ